MGQDLGAGSTAMAARSQVNFPCASVQQEGPVGADSSPATGIAVISAGEKQHVMEPWDQCHLWLS